MRTLILVSWAIAFVVAASRANADVVVVFNEIMYHPTAPSAVAEDAAEWIELRIQMAVDIDMSGWSITGGVNFTFPQGTIVRAGSCLVVAANPGALQANTGYTGALGPWTGRLANDGEELNLRNRDGRIMDSLTYGTDGDWPAGPDGGGVSLAKRSDNLDGSRATSWRASMKLGGTLGAENFPRFQSPVTTTLISAVSPWVYRADGANLDTTWRNPGASEAGWSQANAAFQLGSAPLPAPALAGMTLPAGPTTYYFRRSFDYAGQPAYSTLRLRLLVDDGAEAYLNGTAIARSNLPSNALSSTPASTPKRGAPVWQDFDVPATLLQPAGNVLAVELHQASALPAYPAAVMASGPIVYSRMTENSTAAGAVSDLADLAGSPEQGAQNGTLQDLALANLANAGPRPSDLIGGQALTGFETTNAAPEFQGNNSGGNDVALFPGTGALNFAENGNKFSFEGWVKGPATQEGGGAIVAKGNGGNEQFALDVVSGKYRFYARNSGGGAAVFQHPSIGPNGTWQHIALTLDCSTGLMRMYVNGVDVGGATAPANLLNTSVYVSVGARRLSTGPFDLNFEGLVDEVAFFTRALSASEVSQHYAAAFAASSTMVDTTDAVFASELIATETLPLATPSPFVLNEISTAGVEIANLGATSSSSGLSLRRITSAGLISIPIPAESVTAGSFQQVPISLNPGDRVLLVDADGATVLDSFEVKASPRARFPDGTGEWMRPTSLSAGAANAVTLHSEIVINEIMFDPPSDAYFTAGTLREGRWVEILNKSASAVDLTGWEFDQGIGYEFPAGTILAANAMIVVAENPSAVIAARVLPAAQVFGPWTGNLSGSGETLRLSDALGNPADEVRYASGGRWPEFSNGGGSSLELRDPDTDNAKPEAWAASDETTKGTWQTFTWRGVNAPSQPGEPTLWNELNLLLTEGPGECLVDDVRVTDTVTGANLIQNGGFDSGASKWRFLGNHRGSRVEAEPGNGSNQVLHLIASGPGEYQGNQIETTFSGNQALVAGREYEVALRARWLGGGGRLNTRLYFNRLPKTNVLSVTPNGGTPGAPNTRTVPNIGPTYSNLSHFPVVPTVGEAVTVVVNAADPTGIATVNLKYSVAGGSWQTVAMTSTDLTRFTATVPGQAAASVVQFYVEGTDSAGAVATFPARGAASRALYVVQDGQATGGLPGFRMVMTPADATFLHTPVNTESNEFVGATVIVGDKEVYYDVGARLKGSFVGRNVARVGFTFRFGPDQLFRGVLDKVSVDRSQHAALGVGELLVKHIASSAGGLPAMYDDLARFIHPTSSYTCNATLRMTGFDEVYLDSQFPNGSDGQMIEFEGIRWSTVTVDGNPESPKLPPNESGSSGYANLEVQDYGNEKEAYRWSALQLMHRDEDDYSGIIAFEKLFSQNGASFATNAAQRLDVDEWLRALAFQSLVGPGDSVYTGANIHNFRVYFRPHDGKAWYMPWDWDSSFQVSTNAALVGGGNFSKVVTQSADNTRRYQNHLYQLIQTSYNPSYLSPWAQHYGTLAGQDLSGLVIYVTNRRSYVLSQLPTATTFSASGGSVAADSSVTVSGSANIAVAIIEVDGHLYTPVWSSNTGWRVVIPLAPGNTTLSIRGLDANGALVNGATSSVSVNNPYTPMIPALRINEWMAQNSGAFFDQPGEADDWFELYNGTGAAVNLSGYRFSNAPGEPSPFVIPAGWTIPSGGHLLVWADNQTAQNPATPVTGSALHVPFKLSKNGETIQLLDPTGQLIDTVTFGAQSSNVTEGRFPDGSNGSSTLTLPSPGKPNVCASVAAPTFDGNNTCVSFITTPGISYTLQRSSDLIHWDNVAPAQIAAGQQMSVTDTIPRGEMQFYRVLCRGGQ